MRNNRFGLVAIAGAVALAMAALSCKKTEEPPPKPAPAKPAPRAPATAPATAPTTAPATAPAAAWTKATPAGQWGSLFDGKTLAGWKVPVFGADGKVYVKGGAIHMEVGREATGVTYTGPLVRENYEIALEGMRVDRNDFFCGLTFPVGKDPISLILGGWSGTVVGLSCIDYSDASENETTQEVHFENGQWYRIRVRVTKGKIQVWLDDEKIIDVDRAGHNISIRPEMDLSVPLGIISWKTHGAVRNIRMRTIEPDQP